MPFSGQDTPACSAYAPRRAVAAVSNFHCGCHRSPPAKGAVTEIRIDAALSFCFRSAFSHSGVDVH